MDEAMNPATPGYKACPVCNGAGRLPAFVENEESSVPCWTCKASGEVPLQRWEQMVVTK